MARQEIHKVIYICDRCGYETEDPTDVRGRQGRYTQIKTGHIGLSAMAMSGDWGGQTIALEDLWFCQDCTKDFQEFLNERSQEKRNN